MYIKNSRGHQIKQPSHDKYPLTVYKTKSEIGFIFSIFHDYPLLSTQSTLWWWNEAHLKDNGKAYSTVALGRHIIFSHVCGTVTGQKNSHDYCESLGICHNSILKCKAMWDWPLPVFLLNSFLSTPILLLFLLFFIPRECMKEARGLLYSSLVND